MSISSPLILLFWMTRRAHYLETRPDLAVLASTIHLLALCLIAVPLWHFHLLNAVTGFAALAVAGLISALFSIQRMGVGVVPLLRAAGQSGSVAREHWDFGRWLLPSAFVLSAARSSPTLPDRWTARPGIGRRVPRAPESDSPRDPGHHRSRDAGHADTRPRLWGRSRRSGLPARRTVCRGDDSDRARLRTRHPLDRQPMGSALI